MTGLIIEKLDVNRHSRADFDSGDEAINNYLRNLARQQMDNKMNVCFVLVNQAQIIGYYTLSASKLELNGSQKFKEFKVPKNYQIPVILIGRLGIDVKYQRQGWGGVLILNIIERVRSISKSDIGIRGLIVEPKSQEAESFYNKYGFELINGGKHMFMCL